MLNFLFKSYTRESGKFNLTYNIWDEMYKNDNVLFVDLLKADRSLRYMMTVDKVLYFIERAQKKHNFNKFLLVDTWEVYTSEKLVDIIRGVIERKIFTPDQIVTMPVLYPRQNLIDHIKSLGVELWHANYFFPREYYLNKDTKNVVNPERKLICLNNQDTVARRYMICQLFERGITENISWGGANETRFDEGNFYRWNIQRSARDYAECCSEYDMEIFNKYRDWFYPAHYIEGDTYFPSVADLTISSPIWSSSINLVTETRTQPHFPIEFKNYPYRDLYSNDYLFVTEKTVKALMSGQLFFIFSSKHLLKYLHDLGFKTFGDYIDESYDNCDDYHKRAGIIADNVKNILNMDEDTWQNLWNNIQPIIEYNKNYMADFVTSGKYMIKM